MLSKVISAILSLLYLTMAARGLGPSKFGEFTLVISVAQAIGTLVGFQMWRLVLRFGTAPFLNGQSAAVRKLILRCLRVELAAAFCGCLLAIPLSRVLGAWLHWEGGVREDSLFFAAILLLSVRSTAVGALRLEDRFRDGALASLVTPLIRTIGALAAIMFGATVRNFLIAWAAAEVCTCAAYWLLAIAGHRERSDFTTKRPSSAPAIGRSSPDFWSFALFTNLNSTLASVGPQIALIGVGLFSGSAAAGFFRIGFQLGQALLMLSDMISRALYAEMERMIAMNGKRELRTLFQRTNRIAFASATTVLVAVLVLGKPILYVIGGSAFQPAYPLLIILSAAAGIQLCGISLEPALISANRSATVAYVRALALASLILTLVLLLPHLKEIGGGIAVLVQSILLVGLMSLIVTRIPSVSEDEMNIILSVPSSDD